MKLSIITVPLLTSLLWSVYAKERVPGTKFIIEPPRGFTKTAQSPDHMMESTSPVYIDTPFATGFHAEVVPKGFIFPDMTLQCMELTKREKTTVGTSEYIYHVVLNAYFNEFLKRIFRFGDSTDKTLVVVTFSTPFDQEIDLRSQGSEVFSLLRESDLEPEEYLDNFFDTGTEHQQGKKTEQVDADNPCNPPENPKNQLDD